MPRLPALSLLCCRARSWARLLLQAPSEVGGCSQSEAFPGCLSAADRGAGTAGRSCCWEWLLGAQCCRLDPSLLHISCLQAGHCKPTRKSEERWTLDVTLWPDVSCCHQLLSRMQTAVDNQGVIGKIGQKVFFERVPIIPHM